MAAVMSAASLGRTSTGGEPAIDEDEGPGVQRNVLRRPAIGLMTPNETKKQVTKARKKEAKLLRRAQQNGRKSTSALGLGATEVSVLQAAGNGDVCTASEPGRSNVSSKFGGFEQHTTGFGSRMMAKMGFGGMGAGLGRGEQGIAEPIAAVPRAKKLGLGA